MLLFAFVVALACGWASAVRAAPAEAETSVEPTRMGVFVSSLADISETQRRFEIIFWVWLLPPASDPTPDPAKTLEIMNAVTTERQHSVTDDTPSGRYSQVKLRALVRNPLDFTDFPFDRHVLRVVIEDAERDTRTLEFVPDTPADGRAPVVVSQDLDPQDWDIGELTLTATHQSEPTNYGDPTQTTDSVFSRVVLGIEITRKHSLRILLTLLLGTFMGVVVAFFAVLLPIQQSPPRYTLLSGALFVCIANRLLVDTRLPPGSSLGLIDLMQLAAILGLLLLTGMSLVLTNWAEKKLSPARATQLSQRVGLAWISGLAVVQVLLVWAHAR
ncbi:hypothetical protein ACNOYE_07205 [Nannocystaceae bacterium ST9]